MAEPIVAASCSTPGSAILLPTHVNVLMENLIHCTHGRAELFRRWAFTAKIAAERFKLLAH